MTLRLGVDLRALAALRILLGLLVLLDLFYRVPHIEAFHSDAGVLPRSALTGFWNRHAVHALSGAVWLQGVLFIVQAVAALALLAGHRTRMATVLSFLLLLSLQLRNPYILNAGDLLVRVLLFWAMFLPLGARWSLDARRRETPHTPVADVATAGLLLQIVIIYALNVYHKIRGGAWASGEALQYVFLTERYMTPLGLALGDHPDLLVLLGRGWFGLLLMAPLLLLTTGRVRIVLVGLFAGAHLSMFLLMQIGFFPLVSVVALLPFLPKGTWDLLEHHAARLRWQKWPTGRVLRRISSLRGRLPTWGRSGRMPDLSWLGGARTAGASLFLAWVLLSASLSAGLDVMPEDVQGELEAYGHRWAMFDVPGHHNTWLVVPATLESGRTVDALHLDEPLWDEARYVHEPYPDFRWRKYLDKITDRSRDDLRGPFAAYLCASWNDAHDDRMTDLVLYRLDQEVHLDGTESAPARTELGSHQCG